MSHAPSQEWKCFGLNMWQQVVIALVLGVAVGFFAGHAAGELKVFGTIFLKLIKMVVAPLILFALIAGITSLTESHHFRGIAIKGTIAYLSTAIVAVTFGLLLGTIFEPGMGVPQPILD